MSVRLCCVGRHWIVLYIVHFTAFCLGGPFFPGHGVLSSLVSTTIDCERLTKSAYQERSPEW